MPALLEMLHLFVPKTVRLEQLGQRFSVEVLNGLKTC